MHRILTAVVALAILNGMAFAEQKLQRKDLPAAVRTAVQQEEAKGAQIKNIAAEKESGKTVYEIETTIGGRTRDVIVDAAGTIVVVEEEVAIDSLPAAVRAAFEAAGTITKVEAVTRNGQITYEAQVRRNRKRSEISVDATGKRIKG